jgi:hypothetical protein
MKQLQAHNDVAAMALFFQIKCARAAVKLMKHLRPEIGGRLLRFNRLLLGGKCLRLLLLQLQRCCILLLTAMRPEADHNTKVLSFFRQYRGWRCCRAAEACTHLQIRHNPREPAVMAPRLPRHAPGYRCLWRCSLGCECGCQQQCGAAKV